MDCQYQTQYNDRFSLCALGVCQGRPTDSICQKCVTACRNNPESVARMPAGMLSPTLDPSLPSVLQMAARLAKATVSQIAGGLQTRTPEEAQALVKKYCEPCENYRASDNRCSKCGCFLATKTAWKSQHCPIGKW